ncbi:uncharacterized protein LOC143733379 isoform X2 [Siphateles boraxobius]|uniref:uncharacterized protein LOC143724577 isoform X2 n=1 Tax=Siphateles boraxobius TaxID=180520 RepID=UPI004064084F
MSTSVACASSEEHQVCEAGSAAPGPGCQFSLMEMSEVEYFQHMIQSHMEAPGPEMGSSGFSLEESLSAEPAEEMRMLLEDQPGAGLGCEATPGGGVEVPGSVLDRAQCGGGNEPHRRGPRPLEGRPSPPARVCLEKRFVSVHCHSTNTPGISTHAQIENWSKPDKMVKIQGTYPYGGHLLKTSELLVPTELTVSFRADKGSESVMRAPFVIYTDTADQQTAVTLKNEVNKAARPVKRVRTRALRPSHVTQGSENWKTCADVSCARRERTRPLMDRTQRREVHNRKERDRRRRIRLCCDELNLLVPFCYADTDKATTLQWTTAFLKYIQEIHGDCLKQDFQRTFCGKTGLRLKPSCVSVAQLPHLETLFTHT